MSQSRLHPMEEILLAIRRAAPQPWHYRVESQRQGYNPDAVERILEMLHLEGLVTRGTVAGGEDGPGVVLTPLGERVLHDPEAMGRLRDDQPINPADPGAIIRSSLRRRITPVLTYLIIGANVAVFVWCLYLANRVGVVQAFLGGSASTHAVSLAIREQVLEPAGGVTALDVQRGRWWRLLTNNFVHGGALHILMNMYALYVCGRFVEQCWGRWRYIVIYLVSGFSGSCLGLMHPPGGMDGDRFVFLPLVGASGAISGLLATEAAWVVLNGKYLPRMMAKRWRTQLFTTLILMVFISLLPAVSGYGHLGGALAGLVAAVALNFLRFHASPLRYLAIPVLVAIPLASWGILESARKTNEAWHEAELRVFEDDWVPTIQKTMRSAVADYNQQVKEVRDIRAQRRDPEQVQQAIAVLDQQIAELDDLVARLQRSGPYRHDEARATQQLAIDYASQRAEVYRDARRCLEIGEAWKGRDEKAYDEKWQKMRELRKQWEDKLQ